MNTQKRRAKFKNFLNLLESGCSSTIVMGGLIQNSPTEDAVKQWHTQAGIITTNIQVKIVFTLPKLSATKIMMWNCHVYDSSKGKYDVFLGRDLLTSLGLNIKLSDHVIEADDKPFKLISYKCFSIRNA